ncbi:hypothetical protein [Archaeoglobus veneficus]|uniref:Uncharacterized protein n=1 Tax=Archaeoglobus veneficus (strain DSM 11195 / SNP6) TaxID=693661 RepID=F2KSA6_ARCVS|nr:hypothetical protein [Archaeoglobus veneficus]AEA48045.1 hypothetical protein Arcve_2055 [Archaeoglobus veneficus SNP6]
MMLFRDFGLSREDEIDVIADAVKLLRREITPEEFIEKAIASTPIKALCYGVTYHYALTKNVPLISKISDEVFGFLSAYDEKKVRAILEIITPEDAE